MLHVHIITFANHSNRLMNILAFEFHNLENSRGSDDDIVACVVYIFHETAETAHVPENKIIDCKPNSATR